MTKSRGEVTSVEDPREEYEKIFEDAGKGAGTMTPEELEEYAKQVEAAVQGNVPAETQVEAAVAESAEQAETQEPAGVEAAEGVLNTAETGEDQPATHEKGEGERAPEDALDRVAAQEMVTATPDTASTAEVFPDDGKVHTLQEYLEEGNRFSRGSGKVAFRGLLGLGGASVGSIAGAAAGFASIPVLFPWMAAAAGAGWGIAQGVRYVRHRRKVRDFEQTYYAQRYDEERKGIIERTKGSYPPLSEEQMDSMNTFRKYKPKAIK